MSISVIISIVQIVISFLLVAAILFQQRGAGLSASFGGSSSGFYTKRGIEKILFISTIVLSILFISSTFIVLLIR
ncbi:MAG: preprotein translocase subunit SecG [Candidatus Tagabacteria bacterium CG_4_10_14_0_2_um_filter_40_13]|uniref:Protein-export membrane protein SecG n=2 Tax=Candidatus Tagaibacteriota TaxID=1817918 RepID=A0A2M7B8Z3_9BACT|nr:MAG: preprotein translocase subunit SecG [Candidatus Tagabacteria bacterium CG11_big_fil_rev_8_21_14_0_20_41_11]PIU99586.1 MAG: preprotein translocase subunit SecG [Candidatus Tagabacteria bacterium CG03_land_8_20_14_0_80_41_22]PIZ56515.1 MAG: preprotein translocase subunit SecG [Candidatus Tagabacteria bacterium CG_4_10_14_0_2_um_filter_40_13]PJC25295.1 MAG: preprotein translocase subunit SecG [Candidatus Tagabacteria bacterium CG_4_9_14_0_2_um_filter_41_11]